MHLYMRSYMYSYATYEHIDVVYMKVNKHNKGSMKGQLSAEMLLLIVVILAIVAIAATQLIGSAKHTSKTINDQTNKIIQKANNSMLGQVNDVCVNNEDCRSRLTCQSGVCK